MTINLKLSKWLKHIGVIIIFALIIFVIIRNIPKEPYQEACPRIYFECKEQFQTVQKYVCEVGYEEPYSYICNLWLKDGETFDKSEKLKNDPDLPQTFKDAVFDLKSKGIERILFNHSYTESNNITVNYVCFEINIGTGLNCEVFWKDNSIPLFDDMSNETLIEDDWYYLTHVQMEYI